MNICLSTIPTSSRLASQSSESYLSPLNAEFHNLILLAYLNKTVNNLSKSQHLLYKYLICDGSDEYLKYNLCLYSESLRV